MSEEVKNLLFNTVYKEWLVHNFKIIFLTFLGRLIEDCDFILTENLLGQVVNLQFG